MKSVSFFPKVNVRKIRSKEHYTDEMKQQMFYNRDELAAIQKECREIVLSFSNKGESAIKVCNDSVCTRGLESLILARKEHTTAACFAVLEEQDDQREEGIEDADAIAEVYQDFSRTSQRIAMLRATQDEQAVNPDRNLWEKRSSNFRDGDIAGILQNRRRQRFVGANLIVSKAA